MKHNKFTTRTELKSLRMSIECARIECRSLRMIRVCLVYSSMRLGVPFIAPRQLGAVGGQLGRPYLPSVGWCTGQSGAPPDSPCSCPVRDRLPNQTHLTVATPGRTRHCPVHTEQSGALCRPLERATRRPRIWRPTVALAAVGSPDSLVH